jgi:hypothetical protein
VQKLTAEKNQLKQQLAAYDTRLSENNARLARLEHLLLSTSVNVNP